MKGKIEHQNADRRINVEVKMSSKDVATGIASFAVVGSIMKSSDEFARAFSKLPVEEAKTLLAKVMGNHDVAQAVSKAANSNEIVNLASSLPASDTVSFRGVGRAFRHARENFGEDFEGAADALEGALETALSETGEFFSGVVDIATEASGAAVGLAGAGLEGAGGILSDGGSVVGVITSGIWDFISSLSPV